MTDNIGPRRLFFTLTEEQAFEDPPPRRTLCPRYEECLEHAADQFWVSFTCRGCFLEKLILEGRMKELSAPKIRVSTLDLLGYPTYMAPMPMES